LNASSWMRLTPEPGAETHCAHVEPGQVSHPLTLMNEWGARGTRERKSVQATHDLEELGRARVLAQEGEDRPPEVVVQEVVLVLDRVNLRAFGRVCVV